RRATAGNDPRARGQGPAAGEHGEIGRARRLRLADVFRRGRNFLRQGSPARRGGGDPWRLPAVKSLPREAGQGGDARESEWPRAGLLRLSCDFTTASLSRGRNSQTIGNATSIFL